MHAQMPPAFCKSNEQFRLRFKSQFRHVLADHYSAAEAFGRAWERTLIEVPLPDDEQGTVYWDLIGWAKSYELFTSRRSPFARADLAMAH